MKMGSVIQMTEVAPIFQGHTVFGQKKIENYDKESLVSYIEGLSGPVEIIVRPYNPVRSVNFNAYYWGVVLLKISDFTGHTDEEIHKEMKIKFLPKIYKNSTKKAKQKMFADYVERVRCFAAEKFGLNIPDPKKVYF